MSLAASRERGQRRGSRSMTKTVRRVPSHDSGVNAQALPPVGAAVVAFLISITQRLPPLLVELTGNAPTPRGLSVTILGARVVVFLLTYGGLLGLAFWAAAETPSPSRDGPVAVAAGVAAAVGVLAGAGSTILVTDGGLSVLVQVAAMLVESVTTGVQLGVVVFAGTALARR